MLTQNSKNVLQVFLQSPLHIEIKFVRQKKKKICFHKLWNDFVASINIYIAEKAWDKKPDHCVTNVSWVAELVLMARECHM
jgi:hypothetical protein